MHRAAIFLVLWASSVAAEPNLSAPLLGMARDSHNQLRPVHGLAGNFVPRGAIGGEALDWAFGGSGGLVMTDAELLVLDANGSVMRHRAAPRSNAVLGPDSAFFPKTCEVWQARAQADITVDPAAIGGSVIALGEASRGEIEMAVCRANHLWLLNIDARNGMVTRELAPGGAIGEQACAPARDATFLLLDGRMILLAAQELLVQTASGAERRMPIPASHSMQPHIHRAGNNWVQIEIPGAPSKLVRITGRDEKLYSFPALEALQ